MNKLLQTSLVLIASLTMTACDQNLLNEDIAGDFGQSLSSFFASGNNSSNNDVAISGAAVKGPLVNAEVTAYILDPSVEGLKGTIVGRGTTDNNAQLDLTISENQMQNAPLLIEFVGGTELNGSIPVIPVLRTIVQYADIYNQTPVYATPLSTFILAHAEQQADRSQNSDDITEGLIGNGDGEISASEITVAIAVSQNVARTTFGLDALPPGLDLFRTAPLLNNEQDQSVAVALRSANEVFAAIIEEMQSNALANGLTLETNRLIEALADDFTDGQFDKQSANGNTVNTLASTGDLAAIFSTAPETREVPGTQLAVQDLNILMAQEALDINENTSLDNVSAPSLHAPHTTFASNNSSNNNGQNGNGNSSNPTITPTAPSVSLSSPASGTIYTEGDGVVITANVMDIDNDVLHCTLRLNNQVISTNSTAPYIWTGTNAALSSLDAGSYTAEVSCIDSTNLSSSASRSFAVVAPQAAAQPPLVSFNQPAANSSLIAGSNVSVSLSVSDPENNVDRCRLTINNDLVSIDSNAPYTWSDSSALNSLSAGNYSLVATCTDETDLSHSATRSFVVTAPPPPPPSEPVVSFSTPANGMQMTSNDPLTVTLNASDADNDITQCSLIIDGVLVGQDNSAPYQWTSSAYTNLQNLSTGTHTLNAVCLDSSNLNDTAQLSFSVIPEPTAPSVSFSSPSTGLTITSEDSIQVIVNASDPDGDVTHCDLSLNGQLIRRDSAAPYVWDDLSDTMLDNMNPGNYTLRAECHDAENLSDAASRSFTVAAPTPQPSAPVVSFSAPSGTSLSITEGDTFNISLNTSDADSDIVRCDLIVDNTVVSSDSSAPYAWNSDNVTALSNISTGNHIVQASCVDSTNLSNSANFNLNVAATSSTTILSVELTWSIPSTRSDGSTLASNEIESYEVYYYPENSTLTDGQSITVAAIASDGSMANSVIIDGLEEGNYYFTVLASDTGGRLSSFSTPLFLSVTP